MKKKGLDAAGIVGDNMVITVPIDLIVNAAKRNPEYCQIKITDRKAYAAAVAAELIDFNEDGETGISQFHKLLDDIQDGLIEVSHPTIKVKFSPGSKWE